MAGGRLIWPRLIVFQHLDTNATNYDDDLREPQLERADPNDRIGKRARRDRTISALAQVSPKMIESMQMMLDGISPQNDMFLVFHHDDLMMRGLILTDGDPVIRVNDRLERICTVETERTIFAPRTPPGLYVVEVQPTAYGFGGDAEWNLLKVRLQDRELGADR